LNFTLWFFTFRFVFLVYYGGNLKRFSFPKSKRLVSDGQFKRVLAQQRCTGNGLLMLYMAENGCGYSRLGVSVGKSCGGAVVRNRLKRLLREAFRQNQDRIPAGFDYLLMFSPHWLEKLDKPRTGTVRSKSAEPKKDALRLTFEQVNASFLALVDRIR
jgi:ribonuclease P protein component